jgi:hypothetical protein
MRYVVGRVFAKTGEAPDGASVPAIAACIEFGRRFLG